MPGTDGFRYCLTVLLQRQELWLSGSTFTASVTMDPILIGVRKNCFVHCRRIFPFRFTGFCEAPALNYAIEYDVFDEAEAAAGLPLLIEGLDPFGYPATGHADFPQDLKIESQYADKIRIRLHIWPPNSDLAATSFPAVQTPDRGSISTGTID